ncbi:hypothetical protein HMPREF9151_01435 [Hoylesella saccharolytica F0055]|uniref:Uncharacterized protein n=1 Tax=Hoylesella saccharolytica F0055 TaxID=1127699 RepID=L1N9T4_9BACT|nr:hypothetical protein HMPREF9151_01435 [Hoylesella saccharolytica F0055]
MLFQPLNCRVICKTTIKTTALQNYFILHYSYKLYHPKLKIPHRITVFKTDMVSVGKALHHSLPNYQPMVTQLPRIGNLITNYR